MRAKTYIIVRYFLHHTGSINLFKPRIFEVPPPLQSCTIACAALEGVTSPAPCPRGYGATRHQHLAVNGESELLILQHAGDQLSLDLGVLGKPIIFITERT